MRGPGSRPSLLFQLVVPATAIFVMTILSLIAVLFSDERAPVARWLNRHGNTLLVVELVVVVVISFLAMAVDRWRTLQTLAEGAAQPIDVHSTGAIPTETDSIDSWHDPAADRSRP